MAHCHQKHAKGSNVGAPLPMKCKILFMSFGLLKQGSLCAKKMFAISAQKETLISNIQLIYWTFHNLIILPFLFNTIHDISINILVLVGGVLCSNTILLPSYVVEILLVFLLGLHTTTAIVSCCGAFIDCLMVSSFDQVVQVSIKWFLLFIDKLLAVIMVCCIIQLGDLHLPFL